MYILCIDTFFFVFHIIILKSMERVTFFEFKLKILKLIHQNNGFYFCINHEMLLENNIIL